MIADLDRDALAAYRSAYRPPADFDAFWAGTLTEAAAYPLDVRVAPVATALRTIDVFDVSFAGYGGHPVRAWLRLPRQRSGRLPAVVQFHGYASGRGHPLEDLLWASAGYAHLLMDTRGQGGEYAGGDTGDPVGAGPSAVGFLTRGVADPRDYFYRRVFTDAVRAVAAVRRLPEVDATRVGVVGASQGGGIALAVAGLVPDLRAVQVQAPLLCDIRRATHVAGSGPYLEIARYLTAHRRAVGDVFATLAYFDGIAFAQRAAAPAWFSTALADDTCPPSTVFGAYHEYAAGKHMQLWEYNGHDAGGAEDLEIGVAAFGPLLHDGRAVPSIGRSGDVDRRVDP